MATFTSWSAYLTQLKNSLVSGDFRYKAYSTPAGASVTFSSRQELRDEITWVERKVAAENGGAGGLITRASFEDA